MNPPASILKLIDVLDEKDHIVLIMEKHLGSLSQKIINGALFEKKVRRIIFHLIQAVKYIHEQKLLHRNICLNSFVIG